MPAPSFSNWLDQSSDPQRVYAGLQEVQEHLDEHKVMTSTSTRRQRNSRGVSSAMARLNISGDFDEDLY